MEKSHCFHEKSRKTNDNHLLIIIYKIFFDRSNSLCLIWHNQFEQICYAWGKMNGKEARIKSTRRGTKKNRKWEMLAFAVKQMDNVLESNNKIRRTGNIRYVVSLQLRYKKKGVASPFINDGIYVSNRHIININLHSNITGKLMKNAPKKHPAKWIKMS